MKYDIPALHEFLHQTPESGLRKMLVDPKLFSDIHFNMLMKISRATNPEQFAEHCEAGNYPKIKFSPNETKLKESFWKACIDICNARGLLNPAPTPKAA